MDYAGHILHNLCVPRTSRGDRRGTDRSKCIICKKFMIEYSIMENLLTAVLILGGAGVMLLSALGTRQILALVHGSRYQRIWRLLIGLMLFFLAGYLGAFAMVLADMK